LYKLGFIFYVFNPIVRSCFKYLKLYVEFFQKSWLHRLQDYSIWNEEESFFKHKIRLANFEFSWLKTFALHKVEASDIIFENWVENP
jgi:hypothetical protein